MSRLTWDGTAQPDPGDQILRHEGGQRNIHFYVQLTTSRIRNITRLIHAGSLLYVCGDHATCSGCGKERRILIGLW